MMEDVLTQALRYALPKILISMFLNVDIVKFGAL